MEFIIVGIIWCGLVLSGILGGLIYMVRFFCVKVPRARRWVDGHDGALIGSKEFYDWCDQNGVDPGYYL